VALTILENISRKKALQMRSVRGLLGIGENDHPSLEDKRFMVDVFETLSAAYQEFHESGVSLRRPRISWSSVPTARWRRIREIFCARPREEGGRVCRGLSQSGGAKT